MMIKEFVDLAAGKRRRLPNKSLVFHTFPDQVRHLIKDEAEWSKIKDWYSVCIYGSRRNYPNKCEQYTHFFKDLLEAVEVQFVETEVGKNSE